MPSVKVWVPRSRVSSRVAGGIGSATAPDRGVCGEMINISPPASFMRPSVMNRDLNGEAGLEDIVSLLRRASFLFSIPERAEPYCSNLPVPSGQRRS